MGDATTAGRPETATAPETAGSVPPGLDEAGLRLDVDGAVATVTLNRPERRNAMTFATWRGLAAIGRSLPAGVRVVVLRGEGPSFSAGIDLGMFSGGGGGEGFTDGADAEGTDRFIAELQEGYTWLRRPDIVSVAAVQGHAIGAGFQLALACDIRVIAEDARFCMKEPALGLVPDLTGTKPLVEIVGVGRALELCLTARTVLADEAARIGLAETVVPRDGLDGAVRDLADALLAVNPGAAAATKRLLWQAAENTLDEQCAAERREQIGRLREVFGS
ncbi:enoyl-CoA hydratase/isomerase family protein [Actinomadura citrea]|jgi:enoyl-CoA hydratase/carnithine racemase|uniref:Enoyl-CoA hydratase/carnithine racemase n=1 Tax=Actinomadura citrea TaxID=46158 RepID=A0A7Y9GD61_9ACTN|nr:enoyl-CoA hydratase/isomerase family protein [Actinomadura citrea]NYE14340.1 enoyl-CoA hydratase/carnithine racemase [Actinomadura citrea]GGT79438.1 enoyl-CoA hydratase [Actinomadura citrea]